MSIPPKILDADADKDAAATKIQAGFTGMMVRQDLEADSLEKQMEKPMEKDLTKGEGTTTRGHPGLPMQLGAGEAAALEGL